MKKIILLLFSGLVLSSCSDWFDVTPDQTKVPQDKFFKNENAFLNALTDVYTQLRSDDLYGDVLSIGEVDALGQNFIYTDPGLQAVSNFNFTSQAFSEQMTTTYTQMYHVISSCNNIISQIEATEVIFNNVGQREVITGELYGLRAALHFDLLRLFHPSVAVSRQFVGIPYMTRYGSSVSEPLSTDKLIKNIIADLTHAAELLKRDPVIVGASSSSVLPGQIDPKLRTFFMNYYAVIAMLARVEMYDGNYQAAATHAAKTFDHVKNIAKSRQVFYFFGPGEYVDDYSFSREHIFGVSSTPKGFTAVAQSRFDHGTNVATHYADLFSNADDTRYRDWFDNSGTTTLMNIKFGKSSVLNNYTSVQGSESKLPCRIPVVKLGEMSLIAAEALMRQSQSNLSEAADFVIELQLKRNVKTLKAAKDDATLTAQMLMDEIEKEYRREFYGEGQLFYYYKRLNMGSILKYDGTMRAMTDANYTLPIPAGAITVK